MTGKGLLGTRFRVHESGNRTPIPSTRFPDSDLRRRLFFLTLLRYRTIASHIFPLPYDNYPPMDILDGFSCRSGLQHETNYA